MAITRLMHMKETPNNKPQHLVNAINYVLDVQHEGEKTDNGKWVGGNAGVESEQIIDSFLSTKKNWQKENGRQGYHFVISFPPGEVDAQTCYNVLQDFCLEFLGDLYDYMFAVHTDKEHMHGHIIFNSISRETGYKYRYEKGDWKKSIQPITDKICKEYGLTPLTFDKDKVGVSYAKWSEKKGSLNWTHIMRADIDYAIEKSSNMEDFFSYMQQMSYKLDFRGYSKKHDSNYIVFTYTDEARKEHKHRSYSLTSGIGDSYNLKAIAEKINNKGIEEPFYKTISDAMENKVNVRLGNVSTVLKNTRTYKRMYQAVSYYKLPNPFAVPQGIVRKDMLRLDKLIEECAYLKKNPSLRKENLEKRFDEVDAKLKELYILRKSLKGIAEHGKQNIFPEDISRYKYLQKCLSEAREFDDTWENAEDEMEELGKRLPPSWIENQNKLFQCQRNIENLKKEKKILARVIKEEGGQKVTKEKKVDIVPGH